jgi:integrase
MTTLVTEELGVDIGLELLKRIDLITNDLSRPYFNTILKKLAKQNFENASIICDYIITEQTEMNIKPSTKEGKIKLLVWLCNHDINKSLKDFTKNDTLSYLNTIRKSTIKDATQKWIGTYNGRQMILLKFFRWLYNPDETDATKRVTPTCMQGVKRLPRKEKSPYRHSDIWDSREHSIFLRYCPDKRDRCYHAMANDMSARPHEILNLRIRDIKFCLSENGVQYAEVLIKGGKTGSRTLPLIDSIPYLKEWIDEHPNGATPESWLFVSKCTNNFGDKLTYDGISYKYSDYYKQTYFPKLLEDSSIPDSDKAFIRSMLSKPWNLYVFRHSALTEKSQVLSEAVLRDHAGWTMGSNMPKIYVHLSGESSKILLARKGVINKIDDNIAMALTPKQCPNCNEPNKRDSKFCLKCRMVLSYDAYAKTVEKNHEKESDIASLKEQIVALQEGQKEIFECMKYPEKLVKIAQYG